MASDEPLARLRSVDVRRADGRVRRSFKVLRFGTRGRGKGDAPSGEYTLEMLAYHAHGLEKSDT